MRQLRICQADWPILDFGSRLLENKNPFEPHSRFGTKLLRIRVNLSPKRECLLKGVSVPRLLPKNALVLVKRKGHALASGSPGP